MIHVRPAFSLDAAPMAELLNEIIEAGGTTAMTDQVTTSDMLSIMQSPSSGCLVAVDDHEHVVGFQFFEPHPKLPPDACDIATFVKTGETGLGIGTKLFEATRKAAKALGFAWINANIRTDNEGGLIYYQSRGFVSYGHLHNQTLSDGQVVEKVLKRFDL